MRAIKKRKMSFYEKYIKRILDISISFFAIIILSPIYLLVALMVRIKLGSPILFTQYRPGLIGKNGKEKIFKLYKFRTMTDKKDKNGNLLPDEIRLTKFGKCLRSTSLDELPELFNIIKGDMSLVGPRPQLVKDLLFMTDKERLRHTSRAGLTGLAQVNGRNSISWEEKFAWDIEYIKDVSFVTDLKIIIKTIKTALIRQEGISSKDMATTQDLGDYLLRVGKISREVYEKIILQYNKIFY